LYLLVGDDPIYFIFPAGSRKAGIVKECEIRCAEIFLIGPKFSYIIIQLLVISVDLESKRPFYQLMRLSLSSAKFGSLIRARVQIERKFLKGKKILFRFCCVSNGYFVYVYRFPRSLF
jgi:hypothetical protein